MREMQPFIITLRLMPFHIIRMCVCITCIVFSLLFLFPVCQLHTHSYLPFSLSLSHSPIAMIYAPVPSNPLHCLAPLHSFPHISPTTPKHSKTNHHSPLQTPPPAYPPYSVAPRPPSWSQAPRYSNPQNRHPHPTRDSSRAQPQSRN